MARQPFPFLASDLDPKGCARRLVLKRGSFILLWLFGSGMFARADEGIDLFEKKIRPMLVEQCYSCHSAEAQKNGKLKGELQLDTREAIRKGGESGPAVTPGDVPKSLLIAALRHQNGLAMPPESKLPEEVVRDFERWITLGAPDPRDAIATTATVAIQWDEARQFWAFQPPTKHPAPQVADKNWLETAVDFFVLAELEKRQLKPARLATKRELIRRATFDLTGLPPTIEDLQAFEKDDSPGAYARVVDRLLASPHYGERWGRYWLDVARYADDKALAFATPWTHAYRYRDWVMAALNGDLPYDRFVHLQLAGDLTKDKSTDYTFQFAGLGFQGLGAEYHKGSVPEQVKADELDDRIDTLSRGLLGLTVACARCHDHKYDPIPTRDYYSLAAAYNGASWNEIPLAPPNVVVEFKAWEKQGQKIDADLQSWLADRGREIARGPLNDAERYLLTAWRIRALQKKNVPHDIAKIAEEEKLQPYFLTAYAKQFGAAAENKAIPVLAAWGKAGLDTLPQAEVSGTQVTVPMPVREATDGLVRQLQTALAEYDRVTSENAMPPKSEEKKEPAKVSPEHDALLKAVWLDAKAIFGIPAKEVPAQLAASDRPEHEKRVAELAAHKKSGPPAPPVAHGVSGGGEAMKINVRGNVNRKGEVAPPGFLQVFAPVRTEDTKTPKFTRLDLADAICSQSNPLTARVIVNRVWQHHFGRGLVTTASNFGKVGDRPSHPELLDDLAVRFMESGWSLKNLHRELMLSATYQLGSGQDSQNMITDPGNRYLWRFSPRRLDVEAWRDAVLAVSGRLDNKMGGAAAGPTDAGHVRRTLYGTVSRREPDKMLIAFDFPDANVSSERRDVTTVPQQQLFVLNSDFMVQSAQALAGRLERASTDDAERIKLAFQWAYGRAATPDEVRTSVDFLKVVAANLSEDRLTAWGQFAQAILAANEFAWVD